MFYRSGASGGSNRLDATSSPAGSSARTTLKNEQEKSMPARDPSAGPIKERVVGKVNVRYMSVISCMILKVTSICVFLCTYLQHIPSFSLG